MGQESRHAFAGVLVLGSRGAVVWVLAEVAVSSEGLMGGSTAKFTDGLVGSSLQGSETKLSGPQELLARGLLSSFPCGPLRLKTCRFHWSEQETA